jgi:GTP-binding protein
MDDIIFLKSCFNAKDFPNTRLKEVAFIGKSNVGKSSLINAVAKRKLLAKTSKTPGLTQSINFFDYRNTFMLVDLPGYGYAEVPEKIRNSWEMLITKYLEEREQLKLCLVLIDSRHGIKKNDYIIFNILQSLKRKFIIVFTKADKIKKHEEETLLEASKKIVGGGGNDSMILTSSKDKTGNKELMGYILENIKK